MADVKPQRQFKYELSEVEVTALLQIINETQVKGVQSAQHLIDLFKKFQTPLEEKSEEVKPEEPLEKVIPVEGEIIEPKK